MTDAASVRRVKYRADGSTEQFVSQLAVLGSSGRVERRQDISVNHPMHYKASSCSCVHWPHGCCSGMARLPQLLCKAAALPEGGC